MHVAYLLDLGDGPLANVLGSTECFAMEIRAARDRSASLGGEPKERAAKLVAIYEALTHQLNRWSEVRLWFETVHPTLGGRPIDLMQSEAGLDAVLHHVAPRPRG